MPGLAEIPEWSIVLPDGTELYLTPSSGIGRVRPLGDAMPPVDNIRESYAIRDGSAYQRTVTRERVLTLILEAVAETPAGLRRIRETILEAVSHHRGSLPVVVKHYGCGVILALDCYYDGGLEGGEWEGTSEKIALRLLAPEPYWYELDSDGTYLAVKQITDGCTYIAERSALGVWSNMDGLADAGMGPVIYGPDGTLYAGGAFTTIGGVACARIAQWDGTTWSALGAGLDNSPIALAIAPNGDLYAGGNFHNAGGGAALHIARWNGAAWSAVGAGLDDAVRALAFAPDGTLYIGGAFHNVSGGGIAVSHICKWTGSAYAVVGAGLDDVVYALTTAPNGDLYAAGNFLNVAGGGIPVTRIAKWNGTAWSVLGSGLNGISYGLIWQNGILYAGGAFTTAGGLTASYLARWNGAAWSAIGSGMSGGLSVYGIAMSPAGVLHAGGWVDASGSYSLLPMRWGWWLDPFWLAGDGITGEGAWYPVAIAFHTDGRMAIGYLSWTGSLPTTGRTTINNPGSANAYPIFTLYGPGRLFHLINWTTGQRLDFNLTLLLGETATLDLTPGAKTFTSTFRGNIIGTILPGDLQEWCLQPGDNAIACLINQEFVLNPGFETAGGGGADIWANWTENAGTGALANVGTVHSGADACRATAGVGLDTYVYQDMAVVPGLPLHAKLWTRANGAQPSRWRIYDVTNAADILALGSTGVAGATYTEVTYDFVVPAGCWSVRIYCYCPALNGDIAYFDDVGLWQRGEYEFTPQHMSADGAW